MSEQSSQPKKPSSLKLLLSLVLRSVTNESSSEPENRKKRNEPTKQINNNKILRREYSTKRDGSSWCKYCNTKQTQVTRHMIRKHPETDEVKSYLSKRKEAFENMIKRSNEDEDKSYLSKRKEAFENMIKRSNKVCNQQINRDSDMGEVKTVRKAKSDSTRKSRKVCSDCGSSFSTSWFYGHKNTCLKKKLFLEQGRGNVDSQPEGNMRVKRNRLRAPKENCKMRQNWCKYCNALYTMIMRHMIRQHPETDEVKFYLSITHPDPKVQVARRREACDYITKKSNNIYNQMIMKNACKKKLITVRKLKSELISGTNDNISLVCLLCEGLVTRGHMRVHIKNCSKRKSLLGHESDVFENL